MSEITLQVEFDDSNGWYSASWDAPENAGGISTQARTIQELQENVREAVRCHFGEKTPQRIRLHFIDDLVFTAA